MLTGPRPQWLVCATYGKISGFRGEARMDEEHLGSISRRALMQASATSLVVAHGASVAASSLVTAAAAAPATVTTEQYILRRLSQANAKKLFGVPGATC